MKQTISSIIFFLSLAISSAVFAGKPVNVNTADARLLAESLDGIGEVKAKQIVAYRNDKKVTFKSLHDLGKVKGIGEKTLQKNAKFIKFK